MQNLEPGTYKKIYVHPPCEPKSDKTVKKMVSIEIFKNTLSLLSQSAPC